MKIAQLAEETLGNTWYSRASAGLPHSKHPTLRAAIDVAIAEEKQA
jgi:hypothetical protein